MNNYLICYQVSYTYKTALGIDSHDTLLSTFVEGEKFSYTEIASFQDATLKRMKENNDSEYFTYNMVQVMAVSKLES